MTISVKQNNKIFMRAFLIFSFWLLGLIALEKPAHATQTEHIVATVNEDAISVSDLQDRLRMVVISTGQKPSKKIVKQFTPQVLESLIEEQIQLQEASRLGLKVSPQEIRAQFENIATRNKSDPDTFEKMIIASGINIKTMKNQIRAQIAWSKVVHSKLRSKVQVTSNDIQNHIDRFQRSIGQEEYWVGQISLPVKNEQEDTKIKNLAHQLASQIQTGKADFTRVAQQFSRTPNGMRGETMRWVKKGQLSPELNKVLQSTPIGKISDPVRLSDGYHIIFVQKKRQIEQASAPTKEQIINSLGTARLNRLQKRYLLDLKAAAFIDIRV